MEQKICQCCAMPIDESTFGTEADGSKNQDYCLYCYKNGHFTKDCTMDEMIELNLKYLDEFNKDSEVKYTIDEARATMKEFFPQLLGNEKALLEVNHPYAYRLGEDIYLTGYDVTKDNESEYCILQVVKQPWKYIIVAGILMMLAGAILLFINGPKTDDKLG